MHWITSYLWTLMLLWILPNGGADLAHDKLLVKLFDNPRYDWRVRPSQNYTQPIKVIFRLNLYQLIEVNERNQYISIYAWVTQMWEDVTLTWNTRDFDNLTSIVVPPGQVWKPDTHLYNQVHMQTSASERQIGVILSIDPNDPDPDHVSVVFRYPAIYKFTCHLDVQFFPFDVQHCRMVFGSWQHDSVGIDFFPDRDNIWMESYMDTGEWAVISTRSRRQLEYYTCCPHPYSMLYVDLVIRRRPLHYVANLIMPILVIGVIANLGFFASASTRGERSARVSLGMSTLFALTIILLSISEQMPTSSGSVPLINHFFLGILIQTSSATVITGIILFIHKRGLQQRPVPHAVRVIFFDHLARWFRVPRRLDKRIPPPNFELVSREKDAMNNVMQAATAVFNMTQDSPKTSPVPAPIRKLQSHVDALRVVLLKKFDRENMFFRYATGDEAEEWEWLASIIDRLCLIGSLMTVAMLGIFVLAVGVLTMRYQTSVYSQFN